MRSLLPNSHARADIQKYLSSLRSVTTRPENITGSISGSVIHCGAVGSELVENSPDSTHDRPLLRSSRVGHLITSAVMELNSDESLRRALPGGFLSNDPKLGMSPEHRFKFRKRFEKKKTNQHDPLSAMRLSPCTFLYQFITIYSTCSH